MTFDVAETATGHDRAALIDKFGGGAPAGPPTEPGVRKIDERAIKAHADLRFRSEYDYALFEYYRSAKVIAFLERAGVPVRGRVLDAGCGGGGMPLSLAEEADAVVGIDPAERFQDAGRAARTRTRRLRNLHFALADGMALPFRDRRVRPRAVARRHRARRGCATLSSRMRARARPGRATCICRPRRTCRLPVRTCPD